MPWSPEDQMAIFLHYWSDKDPEIPECPACGVQVRLNRTDYEGGYNLEAICPNGCGELQMSRADDPLKDAFCKWDKDEIAAIFKDYLNAGVPKCPVDQVYIDFTDSDWNQLLRVVAICPRCGGTQSVISHTLAVHISTRKMGLGRCFDGTAASRAKDQAQQTNDLGKLVRLDPKANGPEFTYTVKWDMPSPDTGSISDTED